MWKKLVAGAIAAVAVVLLTLPAPALAGSARYPRYYGAGGHGGPYCYRPPVRYYAPPVRYYAPPPYYYSYRPGVNVQLALPLPFFSVHIR